MACDHRIFNQSVKDIVDVARRSGIRTSAKRTLSMVLRSPNVDKKSREQFALRTHKRLIETSNPTAEWIDAMMTLEVPAGVKLEIKRA